MEEFKKYGYDKTIEANKAMLEELKGYREKEVMAEADFEKDYWENKCIDYGIEIELIRSLIEINCDYCEKIGNFGLRHSLSSTGRTGTYFIPVEIIKENIEKAGFNIAFHYINDLKSVYANIIPNDCEIKLGDNPSADALSYLKDDQLLIESIKNREQDWLLKDLSNLSAYLSTPEKKEQNAFLAAKSDYENFYQEFLSKGEYSSRWIYTDARNIYLDQKKYVEYLEQMLLQTGFENVVEKNPHGGSFKFNLRTPKPTNTTGTLKLELLNKYYGKPEN